MDHYWKSKWKTIIHSFFFRTYLLNLSLIIVAIAICLISASAILPTISQGKSKGITDEAVIRITDQISVIVNQLRLLAVHIQADPQYRTSNPDELQLAIKQIIYYSPIVDDVIVANEKGTAISVYPFKKEYLGKYIGYRPYFTEPLLKNHIYFSEVITALTDDAAMVVGVPISNENHEVVRVIALRIRLTENKLMESFLQAINIGGGGYAYVVDHYGRLISHPDKHRIGEKITGNQVIDSLRQGHSGYRRVTNSQGKDMYASYRYVPELQWGVVAQVPVDSTYDSLHSFQEEVEKYILFLMIPLLILMGVYTRKLIRPIRQLHDAVGEVAKGNYQHSVITHDTTEIGVLAHNFNCMIDNLQEHRSQLQLKREELEIKQAFLRNIIDMIPGFVFTRDREGKYTLVNQTMAQMYGTTVQNMIGKSELELSGNSEVAATILHEDQSLMDKEVLEHRILDLNGKERWFQVTKIPIFSEKGRAEQVLCVGMDITERKAREELIQYQAYHDSLTGLPNRAYFHKELTELIQNLEGSFIAILFLDLDQFKQINDNLGHDNGDLLLQQVSERLQNCLGFPHRIARMGGDEFTIFLADLTQIQEAEDAAKEILDAMKNPFILEEIEFHITTSIGISCYPWDGKDVKTLLKNADTAMYQAKALGKNRYQVYSPEMSEHSWERLTIETNLRKALSEQEFHLVYQPKKDLGTDQVTGMEALIRWNNPQLGLVPPDKFISIAEENGLIGSIGEWVLKTACSQNKAWQDAGFAPIRIALNLSAKQLLDARLVDIVQQTLHDTGLDAKWLELEITESTIMENPQLVVDTLQKLQQMGVHLAIDDFGTGYSSLSYLKRFPIHTIKIDRSFIRDLSVSEDDQAIVEAIIAIAHRLKLKIIAEGVELQEQEEWLRLEGCHEIQGYLFSRPKPAKEVERFLQV